MTRLFLLALALLIAGCAHTNLHTDSANESTNDAGSHRTLSSDSKIPVRAEKQDVIPSSADEKFSARIIDVDRLRGKLNEADKHRAERPSTLMIGPNIPVIVQNQAVNPLEIANKLGTLLDDLEVHFKNLGYGNEEVISAIEDWAEIPQNSPSVTSDVPASNQNQQSPIANSIRDFFSPRNINSHSKFTRDIVIDPEEFVKAIKRLGKVSVSSIPAGAKVYLPRLGHELETTNTDFWIEPGEYKLHLLRNNYCREIVSASVKPNVHLELTVSLQKKTETNCKRHSK